MNTPNFHDFDLIVINTSGGKDSIVAMYQAVETAKAQNFPLDKVIASHQDLGRMEWKGTWELIQKQCEFFGIQLFKSKYRNKEGVEISILEKAELRGAFPSSTIRWCTSDFKRDTGNRFVSQYAKPIQKGLGRKVKILQVFGFRAEESPARAKREVFAKNNRLSTKTTREAWDWLPVHDWLETKVWKVIKEVGVPYHHAYDLGMPRLSCVFCIFANKAALKVAGRANRELLDEYVDVEEKTGHTFQAKLSLKEVRDEIMEEERTGVVEEIKEIKIGC